MTVCAVCHYKICRLANSWVLDDSELERAWDQWDTCFFHVPLTLPVVLRDLVEVLYS